jgi:hypothetical protein
MPKYQGVVARLMAEDKAEILIMPGEQSIPGAPEVSKKVCHECTDGSTLRIEAVNRAGAEIGDWVALTRPAGLVKKNATALIGMPLLGIFTGGGVGVLMMFGMGLPGAALVLCAAIGLLLGVMAGGKQYRALSEQNEPVINRIVEKRSELAAMRQDNQGAVQKDDTACDLCSGCAVR